MKHKLIIAGVITVIAFYGLGCFYDKSDLVYPPSVSTCDTTNITYSTTVTGILNANCYNCHSGNASLGGGIALDTYSGLLPYMKNGHLINDIQQIPGADPMPKGEAKMDVCSINKIVLWINHGMPKN
ncbi:MAG TPA: hypothetical protein VG738_04160 [Chitinophagaceae bacterium]|nr:hypothetical protein [Chitinophagaceae bacterium]